MNRFWWNVIRVVGIAIFITLVGTVGYTLIEKWSLIDALYMTMITLTTVGYGEIHPLTPWGRVFTIFLMLGGITGIAYTSTIILDYLLTNSISGLARERRMTRTIQRLQEHFIVCGYGRVGANAAETIRQSSKHPVVVIDSQAEALENLRAQGHLYVEGDATKDEILHQAGIERARGLLVCTGSDANNLFIVLSARALNRDLFIVTRSSDAENEAKMIRAGANRVISPYQIGGQRMANILVRPNVADFVDVVTLHSGLEMWLEDLNIHPESPLVGKTLGEAQVRHRTGVTLVALRRANREIITPGAETRLEPHDHIIALGTREQLAALEALAMPMR